MMKIPALRPPGLPGASLLLVSDPGLDMAGAPVNLSSIGLAAVGELHEEVSMFPGVGRPDTA